MSKRTVTATALGLLLLLATAVDAAQALPVAGAADHDGGAWSPYVGGALIGVLTILTFVFAKKPVGASSSYATAAGLLGRAIAPRHTCSLKYYQDNPPKVSWELVFISATVLGAFLSAWHSGELMNQWVPERWADRFGANSLGTRAVVGILGGLLMAMGARVADGCTSGHGISGAAQMSASSWISLVCFFAGGAIVAQLLYRV